MKKEVLKWGAIVVVGFLVIRWIIASVSSEASGLQQTWNAGAVNPQLGGGLVFYRPSYVNPSVGRQGSGWRKRAGAYPLV